MLISTAIADEPIGGNWGRDTLGCPRCGDHWIHPDESFTLESPATAGTVWRGYDHVAVQTFWGECGSQFQLCFGFHAGHTTWWVEEIRSCVQDAAFYTSPLEYAFHTAWNALLMPEEGSYERVPRVLFPLCLVHQYDVEPLPYRLDFAVPMLKIGIELDGYTYHSSREVFTSDRQRQRELETAGWRVAHFSGEEIRQNLAGCVQEVFNMLAGAARQQLDINTDFSIMLFRPHFMLAFEECPHESAYKSMAFDHADAFAVT